MLYAVPSRLSLAEIERRIEESTTRHNFGILSVHDLRATMRKKGVELPFECRIYEICNPHQAKKVLEVNGAVSTALPCRISVYGHEGAFTLATILPTALMRMFAAPDMQPTAEEVENAVEAIMLEAAGEQRAAPGV